MKRTNGALRIFVYNWPTYAVTWVFALAILLIAFGVPEYRWPLVSIGVLPLVWSVASLAISHFIYDRSALLSGQWLSALLPMSVQRWATVHAGLDAEVELDRVMPGDCVARLDIFDQGLMTASSIKRARTHTSPATAAVSCSPASLKIEDQVCDVVVVAFTAHEIRNRRAREQFFNELRRCVRPGGRIVLIEHLRDLMNFLAFGPGYLHFMPRSEWLRLADKANFTVAREERIAHWVMALSLERRS